MAKTALITIWSPRSEVLSSQYGLVTCEEWCNKETQRINRNGGRAKVVHDGDLVAVAHDR